MSSVSDPKFSRILQGLHHTRRAIDTLGEFSHRHPAKGAHHDATRFISTLERDVLEHGTARQQLFAVREIRGEVSRRLCGLKHTQYPALQQVKTALNARAKTLVEGLQTTPESAPRNKLVEMNQRARMQQALADGQRRPHLWRADKPLRARLCGKGDAGSLIPLGTLSVGVASAQGKRDYMEDFYVAAKCAAAKQEDLAVVGVFDGHGGADVALNLAVRIVETTPDFVQAGLSPQAMRQGLKDMFAPKLNAPESSKPSLDTMLRGLGLEGGSTALLAVVDGDRFYVANVGDSRAVLVDAEGNAQRMSVDQNPQGMEYERLQGSKNFFMHGGYVENRINMARTVGDWEVRSVGRRPQITGGSLQDGRCLILACDGFYEAFTDEQAATMAHEMLAAGQTADQVAEHLTRSAIRAGSSDNVTVAVLDFKARS